MTFKPFLVVFSCLAYGIQGHLRHDNDATGIAKLQIPPSKTGPLNVSLAIFSGIPDPWWVIQPNNPLYEDIKGRLKNAIGKGLTYRPIDMPSVLGYKGFLVPAMGERPLIVGPRTIELQQLLLQTMPQNTLGKKVLTLLLKEIQQSKPPTFGGKKRAAPDYNPGIWNSSPTLLQNNCYNYATNQLTNTMARPGRKSGHNFPVGSYTGDQVRQAAEFDGLEKLQVVPNLNGPFDIPEKHQAKGHLVALYVSKPFIYNNVQRNDFHWYRLDSNKKWSHKPGKNEVTNKDKAGAEIQDPRSAASSSFPEYQFVCFMSTTATTLVG